MAGLQYNGLQLSILLPGPEKKRFNSHSKCNHSDNKTGNRFIEY